MTDLHKEAEEYAKTKYSFIITKETDLAEAAAYIIAITDYKAGATSKYVQAEKLKAQIEVLKNVLDNNGRLTYVQEQLLSLTLEQNKILEQHLNSLLENEND